jgi:hypothetical protein
MKVEVTKEVLFALMHSHSLLSQIEYERNPTFDKGHFAYIAEHEIIEDLPPDVIDEFISYARGK